MAPEKRKVRRVWIIFATGKALVCEALPYIEEISRNATILGVHAISHGENDERDSFDGRSMYVGGASTMENISLLPPRQWVGAGSKIWKI